MNIEPVNLPDVKPVLTFDNKTGELIVLGNKKQHPIPKTFSIKEVNALLKRQRKMCSIIPLLNLSRMRDDYRQHNKGLRCLSKAILGAKIKI